MRKINEDLRIDLIMTHKDYDIEPKLLSKLIASLNTDQYKIIMLNNFESEFSEFDKYVIVDAIKDENLKKDIIDSNKYNLDARSIAELTTTIGDIDFKKKKLKEFTSIVNVDDLTAQILGSFDKEEMKRLIDDHKDYGINVCSIVLAIKELDKQSRHHIFDKLYEDGDLGVKENVKMIKTDPDLTIGIEIEYEGSNYGYIKGSDVDKYWVDKHDSSLDNGIEVVSPIMRST